MREFFTLNQQKMLIRFIAKNIYSFKDETEFNLFPNKAQGLQHHKVKSGDFEFLRFSANIIFRNYSRRRQITVRS